LIVHGIGPIPFQFHFIGYLLLGSFPALKRQLDVTWSKEEEVHHQSDHRDPAVRRRAPAVGPDPAGFTLNDTVLLVEELKATEMIKQFKSV